MNLMAKRRQKRAQEAYSRGARAIREYERRMARPKLYKPAPEPEPEQPVWVPPPNPWTREHYNLTEQGRILREDPELARRFKREALQNYAG